MRHIKPKQVLDAAGKALNDGDITKAISLYAQVLNVLPKHSGAKKGLAKARKLQGGVPQKILRHEIEDAMRDIRRGKFEAGLRSAQALAAKDPSQAFFQNLVGIAYAGLGELPKAIKSYKNALGLQSNFAEARGNLGAAQLLLGEHEEALKTLSRSVQEKDDDPKTWSSYGSALRQVYQFEEAHSAFAKAVDLAPDYLTALAGLAATLKDLWKFHEAMDVVLKALPLAAQDWEMLSSLGATLLGIGETQRAIDAYEQALALRPSNPELLRTLGVALGQSGTRDRAVEALTSSIKLRPENGEAYSDLSSLVTFKAQDPIIEQMRAMFETSPKGGPDRMHLGFALAKALHDIGDFDGAFPYLRVGNDEKRATLNFDIDHVTEFHSKAIAAKTERLGTVLARGDGPRPIFIVGMNRSGTSLVEQILSTHSMVHGAGELPFVDRLAKQLCADDLSFTQASLDRFAARYIEELSRVSSGRQLVTDKMPVNFRWIGLLRRAFPDAPIIQMQRDARDVCLSNYRSLFVGQGNGFAYDLVEVAQYHNEYVRLMDHWHSVFPGEIYACDYERLTRDQEGETRALLERCGLEWEASVLDFHKTRRAVRTASVGQVRQKMYTSSVGAWGAYEAYLGPMLTELASTPQRANQ